MPIPVNARIDVKFNAIDAEQGAILAEQCKLAVQRAMRNLNINVKELEVKASFEESKSKKAPKELPLKPYPKNAANFREFQNWLASSDYIKSMNDQKDHRNWIPGRMIERALQACHEAIPEFHKIAPVQLKRTYTPAKLSEMIPNLGLKHAETLYKAIEAFNSQPKEQPKAALDIVA